MVKNRLKRVANKILRSNRSMDSDIVPSLKILPNDVFIISYPKSGNTWLRFLVANYMSNNQCTFENSHFFIPDIHYNPEYVEKLPQTGVRFIKSHSAYTSTYPKVVYVARDGRDVAVSYYFYLKKFRNISEEISFHEFLEKFNQGALDNFSSWGEHVVGWLSCQSPDNLLLIKYDDMKQDTLGCLKRVLSFSNIDFDMQKAKAAVEASSFKNMQKQEDSQKENIERFKSSNTGIRFVRKGKTGEWKNFFTAEAEKKFVEVHGDALRRLGYII